MSQRIVRAAWIAVHEHLAEQDAVPLARPAACGFADQAAELRRLVMLDRFAVLEPGGDAR